MTLETMVRANIPRVARKHGHRRAAGIINVATITWATKHGTSLQTEKIKYIPRVHDKQRTIGTIAYCEARV